MPPDLALSSTLIGLNYPCLELIFIVPKVFEPLKFDCIYVVESFIDLLSEVIFEITQHTSVECVIPLKFLCYQQATLIRSDNLILL